MTARRYTEMEFRAALDDPAVRTMADLCRAVGIVPRGANYETLRSNARDLGLDADRTLAGRQLGRSPDDVMEAARRASVTGEPPERVPSPSRLSGEEERLELAGYGRAEVHRAVVGATSRADAIRALGHEPSTTAYDRLQRAIDRFGIDVSHLARPADHGGRVRRPLDELLVRGRRSNTSTLRRRRVEAGLKQERCEQCDRSRWEGDANPLELDHVDGDRTNNRLENLRSLCPNGHALTPTYRSRNRGRR